VLPRPESGSRHHWERIVAVELRNDLRRNAAVEVIYNAVYPSAEWAPVAFEEARSRETVHYRQAVEAALLARPILSDRAEQLALI
jgi:hypothetical protein